MIEAGEYMLGCHDFRNLCKMDIANGVTEFVRNIKQITISPCNLAQAMDSENRKHFKNCPMNLRLNFCYFFSLHDVCCNYHSKSVFMAPN